MTRTMTDKFRGVPAKLRDEQASSLYQAKSTFSAEQRLLFAFFVPLHSFFLAACNLGLRTEGRHKTIL